MKLLNDYTVWNKWQDFYHVVHFKDYLWEIDMCEIRFCIYGQSIH